MLLRSATKTVQKIEQFTVDFLEFLEVRIVIFSDIGGSRHPLEPVLRILGLLEPVLRILRIVVILKARPVRKTSPFFQ